MKIRSEELLETNIVSIIAYIIWSYSTKNTGKGVVMILIIRNLLNWEKLLSKVPFSKFLI